MATAKISYEGNLRTQSIHLKSGNQIITDAPTDNHGKGEAFSPTDLLATSLGCCMLTIMGIRANQHNIAFTEATADITKIMESNPRRVGEVMVAIKVMGNYSNDEKAVLEDAAINCPVAKSLSSALKQTVSFHYH